RFCLALASAAANESGRRVEFGVSDGDIDPTDSTAEVVRKLAFQEARAVEETAATLDLNQVERVVDGIFAASVVDLYGSAGSGPGGAGPAAEAAPDRIPGQRVDGRPPGHHQRRCPSGGRRGHCLLPLGGDRRGDLRARDRGKQR